jgi:hypothetical protein
MPRDACQQLRLAIGSNAGLKPLERYSTAIDGDQRCSDVLDDLL